MKIQFKYIAIDLVQILHRKKAQLLKLVEAKEKTYLEIIYFIRMKHKTMETIIHLPHRK